jgi:hypothetical protein
VGVTLPVSTSDFCPELSEGGGDFSPKKFVHPVERSRKNNTRTFWNELIVPPPKTSDGLKITKELWFKYEEIEEVVLPLRKTS